ncbi:hypothetical protein D3C74_399440 [compost metagenome]
MSFFGRMNIFHQYITYKFLIVAVNNHPHAVPEKVVFNFIDLGFQGKQTFAAGNGSPLHEHGNEFRFADHFFLYKY